MLSIGLGQVLAVRDAFPGAVRMAELRRDGAPVAAALTYQASPPPSSWSRGVTPITASTGRRCPCSRCGSSNVRWRRAAGAGPRHVDAARPGRDGVPNDGLVQFKRALGARAELRPVLVRRRA